MNTDTETDRAAFEKAVRTARSFVERLEQHVAPEVAQLATWTAVMESAERLVGREQLAAWLAELSSRLNTEGAQACVRH